MSTRSQLPFSLYVSAFLSALLSAALVGATFWFALTLRDDEEWVRKALTFRRELSIVSNNVQAIESDQRGYLLTNRTEYFDAYAASLRAMPVHLESLARVQTTDGRERDGVARLRVLIAEKLREMEATIRKAQEGDRAGAMALVNTDNGFQLMSEIRRLCDTIQENIAEVLANHKSEAAQSAQMLSDMAAVGFVFICFSTAMTAIISRRSLLELAAANNSLKETNEALLLEAQRRTSVEDQLRQSQKMEAIGQLTGGIAHDFNNMLAVMRGSLNLIRRKIKSGDTNIEPLLTEAEKANERSITLTRRLLAFARRQPLAPESVCCNRLITDMSNLLRSTLGEHIAIETVLAAGLWSTLADAHELENAILNIAINSRDAMPDGGRLTIETGNASLDDAYCHQQADLKPGQFVMVALTDTGCGMSPETVEKAFDPFYTTKEVGKGTGLGLSQVFGFVKQSRGHLKIYSEPGVGTTVKIYLPRAAGSAVEARKELAQARDSKGECVLLVEDEPLMLKITADALRELGYTVHACGAPSAALDILDATPQVQLLLTDVVMPEMNGKQLATEALRRRPDLKVIFTTGYTSNAVVHGGVLDPDVNFLSKPFTFEQLAAKLRAVLD